MANNVKKGSWVDIYQIILKPEERAPQVPDDTKKFLWNLKQKGFYKPTQLSVMM
jgi:hypothetical protein